MKRSPVRKKRPGQQQAATAFRKERKRWCHVKGIKQCCVPGCRCSNLHKWMDAAAWVDLEVTLRISTEPDPRQDGLF